MIAGIAGLFVLIASLVALFHHAPLPVIAYDFHYRIAAPAALHGAQLFAGTHHTYLILPPGATPTDAAFVRRGHWHPVTPRRDGPYWQLSGVAPDWRLTTTRGLLSATAFGPLVRSPRAAAPSGRKDRARARLAAPMRAHASRVPISDHRPLTPGAAISRPRAGRLRVAAIRFTGNHLSRQGAARLMALRAALQRAAPIRILACAHGATPEDRHRAARRAVILAATLLRWGIPARHLRIRVLAGDIASVEIAFVSAHKDTTP